MTTETMQSPLEAAQRVYATWGKHPRLYAAAARLVFLGREALIRRRAVAALNLEAGARVLEVGCGTGCDFPYLEEAIGPGGQLVGFDQSERMLAAAEQRVERAGWDNVRLIRGNAEQLDVAGEPFDGVVSVLAMSVVPDYRAAIARSAEVLRPGGRLVICDAGYFRGPLSAFNPIIRATFVPLTCWHPDHDLPAAMRETFGNVRVEALNAGSMMIATSVKNDNGPSSSG